MRGRRRKGFGADCLGFTNLPPFRRLAARSWRGPQLHCNPVAQRAGSWRKRSAKTVGCGREGGFKNAVGRPLAAGAEAPAEHDCRPQTRALIVP